MKSLLILIGLNFISGDKDKMEKVADLENLSVVELQNIILRDFVEYKIKSGEMPGYAVCDLTVHGIEGWKEALRVTVEEAVELKKEMVELIIQAMYKYAFLISKELCEALRVNQLGQVIEITRQIVQNYLRQEMGFPTDEITLSLYLIKSELLTGICTEHGG